MRKPFYVRCYGKQVDDQWVAICIDLCLAAQADTLQEAKDKLEAQVNDYVYEALTVDRAHAAQLLTRKAPLRNRLEYYALKLRQSLRDRNGSGDQAFEELVAVPA